MLTRRFLFMLSFSLLFQLVGFTQELEIGLMPIRVKFVEKESRTRMKFPTKENMMEAYKKMYVNEGIVFYNDTYYPLLEKELLSSLEAADIKVTQLKVESLDTKTIEKEQELFDLLFYLLGFSSVGKTVVIGNDTANSVSKSEQIATLTRYFGRKLDKDYLLFFTFNGRHYPTKKEKKNKIIPQYAKGNIGVRFFIVEASSGLIVKSIVRRSDSIDSVDLLKSDFPTIDPEQQLPARKKLTEKRIQINMKKMGRKVKWKLKKLD